MLTALVTASAAGEALLKTVVGTGLDPLAPQSSVGVEAKYIRPVAEKNWVEIYGRIDRPFDRHENFHVPFLRLTSSFRLATAETTAFDLRPFAGAVALDRWGYDGARGRIGASSVVQWLAHPDVTVQAELAPWAELTQYRTSPEGREFPLLGVTEKLTAEGRWRSFFLELSWSFQQSYRHLWRNDLGVQQRLGYRFSPSAGVGVAHEYVAGRLDETTGYLRPLTVFDSRLSRVSVFGEFVL